MTVRLLPIFPLPLVLFPRAPLPLHIFEPRYRRMVADCLERDRQFGIVSCAEDQQERDIAPGTVGCVARVERVEQLPDGRSNIIVEGTERFTLERFVADPSPYYVGEIATITDTSEPESALTPLAERLQQVFERVGRSARAIADDVAPLPDLPAAPSEISFAIAQYIDLDLAVKQDLLSSRSPAYRLRRLTDLLEGVVDSVERRAAVHERARSNGHGPHPGSS